MPTTITASLENYHYSEVAWTQEELRALAAMALPGETLPRYARIPKNTPADQFDGLLHFLELADETFMQIAEECGARVVSHYWGIAELPPEILRVDSEQGRPYQHPLIPEGFGLVADVAVLTNVTSLSKRQKDSVWLSLDDVRNQTSLYWTDGHPSQFSIARQDGRAAGLFLVDVEPSFKMQPQSGYEQIPNIYNPFVVPGQRKLTA